ncbi:hypothetical protein [Streptomyces sp. NPDC047043]|uniref:hypothetical protein n=1 Tax=Streptomyces sp. NPDC047043 TaxID=3154497 RepID=UPI0033E0CBF6
MPSTVDPPIDAPVFAPRGREARGPNEWQIDDVISQMQIRASTIYGLIGELIRECQIYIRLAIPRI